MKLKLTRPDLSADRAEKLNRFLQDHWKRASDARVEQVDDDYTRWDANYYGVPAEKVRTVPFYKSSNLVVKVSRIFIDTFVARTLNVIFATKPLYVVDGFPREVREGLEQYLNRKALYNWHHYQLARELLHRGAKNGTAVAKVVWDQASSWTVESEGGMPVEEEIVEWEGPCARVIPFEDFAVYPITANFMRDVEIAFHRVRYSEERAKHLVARGEWELSLEDVEAALDIPRDLKRTDAQSEAGVVDSQYREMQAVECHLSYAIGSDPAKLYNIVGVIQPRTDRLIDVYFNPNPRNKQHFYDYRPLPKEDLFYGESYCSLLESLQEEVSSMHNERRNNSAIANAPVFKRRSGSNLPNPSSNWYPGKVFDLEDMDDLQLEMVGRNYDGMLDQESYDMQLAERLSGIGAVMQGYAAGMMGKRGIYNAQGTIAVMQESNQRQDTNIRDVREVLSAIAKGSYSLQAHFGSDDPMIEFFPPAMQTQIHQAMVMARSGRLEQSHFEVKASSAGANAEIEKANLMTMAQVLERYGGQVQQLTAQLANPKLNPAIRLVINDTLAMQRWMAARVMRAYNELDVEGILPDAKAAIERIMPGGGQGTQGNAESAVQSGEGGMDPGTAGPAGFSLTRENLAGFSQMAGAPQA